MGHVVCEAAQCTYCVGVSVDERQHAGEDVRTQNQLLLILQVSEEEMENHR